MPGPMYRVAEDKWNIDACPHHGPAIAISAGGAYHVAWFTEGDARQGLFYATSQDGGAHFTLPAPIGAADKNPGRAQLLAIGKDGLPKKILYEVLFQQIDLWPDYAGPATDTLLIDIYEHWLIKA